TLSQVKGVDYVSFSVKGEPLKIDGKIVEAMNENNFSSDLSGEEVVQETDDFTLYYANEKGTALKLYKISKADYSGMTKEEFVVRKLIEGPQKKGYTETLSKAVQLRSVATVDSICYVDFDENFLTEQSVVSNKLVIYSLVNSILELTDIHKVQITVKGRSDIYYHDEVSLGKPLDRNLDLVK
ncbi:MAG: GerMN domain-containing protein, partial [Eubacterium sp.]|nr:GerMN domain-containing protein [Eubacterium sp.]